MGACGAKGRVLTARKPAEEEKGPKDELLLFFTTEQSRMATRVKSLYEHVLAEDTEQVETLNLQFSSLGPQQVPFLTRILDFYPRLRILKLWKAKLTAEGAQLLSPSLCKLTLLESLGLEDNQLTDRGVSAIATSLPSFRLKELFLQINAFELTGATALSRALTGMETLETLNVSENRLGIDGLKALLQTCGASLLVLELAHCELGKEGADVLLEAWPTLKRLKKLKVSGNGFGDELERTLLQKSAQVDVLI